MPSTLSRVDAFNLTPATTAVLLETSLGDLEVDLYTNECPRGVLILSTYDITAHSAVVRVPEFP